jgi:hypothetical protein
MKIKNWNEFNRIDEKLDLEIKVDEGFLFGKKKTMKNWKNFNESYNDEVGEINLYYNGEGPTTWFFIQDAIRDGLLEEKLDLIDDIIIEYDDELDMETLTDNIIDDFEPELDKLLDFLINKGYLDSKPTIEIEGEDEDGDYWEFTYFPEN